MKQSFAMWNFVMKQQGIEIFTRNIPLSKTKTNFNIQLVLHATYCIYIDKAHIFFKTSSFTIRQEQR